MMRRAPLAAVLAALACLVAAPPAGATFPGANGLVTYARFTGGDLPDLFSANPNGSGETPLGISGSTPAYSADGRQLAYVDFAGLWVADADGKNAALAASNGSLGTAESPAWSPDGRQIAFGRSFGSGGTSLAILDLGTRTERTRVADVGFADPAPSWSPDGSTIAYVADVTGGDLTESDLFTIPAAGSAIGTDITPGTGADTLSPDWSPDGTRLAASRNAAVVVMNADGSGATTVSRGANGFAPSWSPDGRFIAYEEDTEGGDSIRVVDLAPGGADNSIVAGDTPAWQPVDTVPPTVTLRVPAQGARYAQNAHVLSDYICNDPAPGSQVVVQCSGTVPAEAPVPTSTPGTHTFTVTAVDRMGNRTVVTHTYTVVPPPPVTRILTGPPSQTRSRTATFTFTATHGPVSFECELDGGGFRPCSGAGTDEITGLSLGVHHFRVRARNAGGVDQHPPEWRWKVLPKRMSKRAIVFSTFERHVFPREFVLFRSVVARHVPAGTRISASCSGRGCPQRHRRTWLVRTARDKVRLTSWIRDHELLPTAAVFVELTKPGFVGKGKLYCVRHHKRVRIVSYTVGRPRPACR